MFVTFYSDQYTFDPSIHTTTLPAKSFQAASQQIPSVHAATQSVPSFQATTNPAPSFQATTLPAPSSQATKNPTPSFQAASLSISSIHATSQPIASFQAPSTSFRVASQPALSFQATTNTAPSFQAASLPTPSVHATSQPTASFQATTHSTPSSQATSQQTHSVNVTSEATPSVRATSRKRTVAGHESTQHWTVEGIDSEGNMKKLKVNVRDVLNLNGEERIVLDFVINAPIGEAQPLLAGFCGILACDCTLFPINFEKWPDLPISYFNRVFEQIIKPRFHFKTIESVAWRHVYNSISKKWSENRLKVWQKFYDPLKSRVETMDNVPAGIPQDQWISFVDYKFKEKTMEMCKRNAENRKNQTIPHTGGSKSNARRMAEMMAETEQRPGRAQVYLATHTNQDGEYVNEAAKDICPSDADSGPLSPVDARSSGENYPSNNH